MHPGFSFKNSVFSAIFALGLSPAVQADSPPLIDTSPTFVSIVMYEAAENFTSQFGHIDLRFSYGARPQDDRDIVVGFGPPPDTKSSNPLLYFGIGGKLKLINWSNAFQQSYEEAAKVKMIGVYTLTLDLNARERHEIAVQANEFLSGKKSVNYHTLWRNCSSVVAKIISDSSETPRGPLSFLPYKLEKKLQSYSIMRSYLPSGRALKRTVLEKNAREYARLFSNAEERAVFEQQLMSRHTEFRQLAFAKLAKKKASKKLVDALLDTELNNRQELFQALGPQSKTTELVVGMDSRSRFESLEVKKNKVVLKTSVANFGRPNQAQPPRKTTTRSWTLAELGIKAGDVAKWKTDAVALKGGKSPRLVLWLAPDQGLDPR